MKKQKLLEKALRLLAKSAWIEAAMAGGIAVPVPRYRPAIYQVVS
jgi:hypothetical protein